MAYVARHIYRQTGRASKIRSSTWAVAVPDVHTYSGGLGLSTRS